MAKSVKFKVYRYDPRADKEPRFETYEVPYKEKMRVLDGLNYIHDHYDGTLAYRWICRAAQCGSCTVTINSKPSPACKAEVPENADTITIEPLRIFPVIKDLVTDMEKGYKKFYTIRPYVERSSPPARPEIVSQEDIKEIKELRSCIECWSCVAICPVVNELRDEYQGPFAMRKLAELSEDKRDKLDRISMALFEGVYNCTTCKNCWAVCPQELEIPGKAIEKLRSRAIQKGLAPLPAHKIAIASIRNYWNPWQAPRAQRARWAKEFELPEKGETIFFAGCSPSLLKQELAKSVVQVLKAMGINVAYLGKNERCCSSPLLRIGDVTLFKEMAKANIEEMKKAGAKRIIVTCAGCYKAWKEDYPAYLGDYGIEVKHITEIIANALKKGDIKFKDKVENHITVTYHDPCHLGRAGGIYESPRQVINAIPGMKLIEMARNRENSACCGSGGGVKTARPELSILVGQTRWKMVEETNAQVLLSCCPWCEQNLEDVMKAFNAPRKTIKDVIEMIADTIEKQGG